MGLMNASQQFQQMMADLLEPCSEFAIAFVDDILIFTHAEEGEDIFEKHYQHLKRVLDILAFNKLVCSKKSAPYFGKKLNFVGIF